MLQTNKIPLQHWTRTPCKDKPRSHNERRAGSKNLRKEKNGSVILRKGFGRAGLGLLAEISRNPSPSNSAWTVTSPIRRADNLPIGLSSSGVIVTGGVQAVFGIFLSLKIQCDYLPENFLRQDVPLLG